MRLLPAAILVLAASAAGETCAFDYSAFELSMPHVDLEICPEGVEDGDFYQASVANDLLHVFVFSEDATACLTKVVSLDEGAFEIVLRSPSRPAVLGNSEAGNVRG
jgi:hypothetical protein